MRGINVVQDTSAQKLDLDTAPATRAGNHARTSTSRAKAVRIALGLLIPLALLSYFLLREYAGSWSAMPKAPLTIETARGPVHFTVEVATTKDQWERGLMFRKSLAPDAGMLFDLAIERQVALWMKDTLIPLDMVFIRANGTIVRIVANAKPLSLDNISSTQPVRAVLEIPGGRTAELGIEPGDTVIQAIFGNGPR